MPYIYSIAFHGLIGQTIGKLICGIKVYNYDEKVKINMKQAILRDIIPLILSIICYLVLLYINFDISKFNANNFKIYAIFFRLAFGGLFSFWYFLEFVTMLFNPKRRAIQDFIANTIVIKV